MSEQSYTDWMLKSVGVFLAFVYSVGFLVVGRHLSRYGVSALSLLQSQYLVAGLWAIGPPILIAIGYRTGFTFTGKALTPPYSWRRFSIYYVADGLFTGVLFAAVALLFEDWEGFTWSMAASLSVAFALLGFTAVLAWMSWRAPDRAP